MAKTLPTVQVHGQDGPMIINQRDFDPSRHLIYVEGESKEQAFQKVVEEVRAAEAEAAAALFQQLESEDSEDEEVAYAPETDSAVPQVEEPAEESSPAEVVPTEPAAADQVEEQEDVDVEG